jgi:hypothetical protein
MRRAWKHDGDEPAERRQSDHPDQDARADWRQEEQRPARYDALRQLT